MKKLLTLAFIAQCISPAIAGLDPNLESSPKSVETTGLDPAWTAPIFGAGMQSNGNYTDGHFLFLYPWNNSVGKNGNMEGSMFFFEPHGIWGSGGEVAGSLALGYRHLISHQSVDDAMSVTNPGLMGEGIFIGANTSIDYGESANGVDHGQVRFGLALASRYIELRGNYYLPFTDTSPVGYKNGIEFHEEALEGWDAEVAVLVPGIEQYMDVQLIGGYYNYQEGDLSSSGLEGWRAGVEVRPVPNFVIGATWLEQSQLYDDNWLASFRIEIPLGGNSDMYRSAFKSRRRHLAERMFKPIRRKNSWWHRFLSL